MFKNPILLLSLSLTGGVAAWGIVDAAGSGSLGLASMLDLDGDGNFLDDIQDIVGKTIR
jgi:hypothetical protein